MQSDTHDRMDAAYRSDEEDYALSHGSRVDQVTASLRARRFLTSDEKRENHM